MQKPPLCTSRSHSRPLPLASSSVAPAHDRSQRQLLHHPHRKLALADFLPPSSVGLLPLTLFYTSIPTLFLLVISSLIFRTEYAKPTSSEPDLGLWLLSGASVPQWIVEVGGERLLRLVCGGASWVGASGVEGGVVRGWANEVVLRRAVGGSSAVVGLSGECGCVCRMVTRRMLICSPHVVCSIAANDSRASCLCIGSGVGASARPPHRPRPHANTLSLTPDAWWGA